MKLRRKGLAVFLPGLLLMNMGVFAPLSPAQAKEGTNGVRNAPPSQTMTLGLPKVEPGSTEEAKLLMSTAPSASDYPNAAAAFLLDLENIEVRPDGSSRKVIRATKKIFNKRGRDDEAEVKVGYNSHYQTLTVVRARTIKPDGTIVEVKPEDIRTSRPSDYDDYEVLAFSMPAVEDGSIIDYEYVIDEKESMMPGQFWSSWYFQGGFDPVMLTRLSVTVPKGMKLNEQIINSAVKPKVTESKDGKAMVYTWEDNNVAPLELEPMMPSPETVLPTLFISTVPSWQKIADWYYTMAKDRTIADESVKKTAREVTKGKNTAIDKAKAIFYYVQGKTRYVAIELGKSAYQPRSAPSILTNQYGDCKDMTTLLVSMLREVGITAHPVLLEAGSKETKKDKLPSPGAFNHAICLAEIGGEKFWLDATAELCPWGVIPSADRGCDALVIRDGVGTFETIPYGTPEDNKTEQKARLKLNPDGSATGSVTLTGTGDLDIALRGVLRDLPVTKMRPYAEGTLAAGIAPDPRVSDVRTSDFRDMEAPTFISYDVTFPSWAQASGDLLIFKARPDQASGAKSSPFREDIRQLPIKQDDIAVGASRLELELPEGYEVLSIPQNVDIKSDLGRFTRTVEKDGNKLIIVTRGENYRAEVPASRYDEVRKYYRDYLKASDDSVILKKTSN